MHERRLPTRDRLVPPRDAQPKPMPDRDRPQALPELDARPLETLNADAPALVARPPATTTCTICGTRYGLGERADSLFESYPRAESRYWQHCLTEAHQRVLRARDLVQQHHLSDLPTAIIEGKAAQTPLYVALRRFLA